MFEWAGKIKDGIFAKARPYADEAPTFTLDQMEKFVDAFATYAPQAVATNYSPDRYEYWSGDDFEGGFGNNVNVIMDWAGLRERSHQLFTTNLFASGIIDRLVTNIIATGLFPESIPDEGTLGLGEGDLDEWTDSVENLFSLWANCPEACDYAGERTLAQLQRQQVREAFIGGDCLVIHHVGRDTLLPRIELISSTSVCTPMVPSELAEGHKIYDGVEVDARGREVAYWVYQVDGTFKRIAAYGPKTRRRIAFLLKMEKPRPGVYRGTPLLAKVLQSLREVQRFRSAYQRKVMLNALVAFFLERDVDTKGKSTPAATVARGRKTATRDNGELDETNPANFSAKLPPGMIMEGLRPGETVKTHQGPAGHLDMQFEDAVLRAIAWGLQMPPEILMLSFSSNYSASQAAINEFKLFLSVARMEFADQSMKPLWKIWFTQMVLIGRIAAEGYIVAYNLGVRGFQTVQAWLQVEFAGAVKPSSDLVKQVEGYVRAINNGLCTRNNASQALFGIKYGRLVRILRRENEQLAPVLEPLTGYLGIGEGVQEKESEEDG